MICIFQIETSTKACSLALSMGKNIIFERVDLSGASHVADLGIFTKEAMEYVRKNDCPVDAVAVSAGPGSYTGLRIGVSLAKGLCYGLDVPLIAIPSLKIICRTLMETQTYPGDALYFCPMIDARRMEVYAAVYDKNQALIRDVNADIVCEDTYNEYLSQGKVLFFGDGSDKCKSVIHSPNAVFIENIYPSAAAMTSLANEAFDKKAFADVAYFEPFYLKEFQATVPKNKVIALQPPV
ncbi:MAG: tRNA (adenosine(37)-N6)-threonylcarbamoyltransferase complex dimerization subunit type 1 TsaB [Dysgonamonadaceae bacterium]|jgi:tRNA threonylcarbamoyladenosine biosynthesis protein TsaB|nr:tRNA (adenosine(37)-N6)-threonylcarbamoyltransferase complex dimerization subunit type 1 TsaB [Dysgonamonadaceae bacterium]